ncbi:MAG: molybdopterin-guanine dinucleotide biosynthesis protein MobB [Crocinitomicaceae bacterium]|nr:molybdopterin-guanine dinucleotide biosynthesis protein MobB [Crocinitomicaceae bacterium]
MIIGICGGSGSGKTTLLNRLYTEYKDLRPSVFSMDNYYRPIEHQQIDKNGEVNFDLPTALDEEKLVADLQRLVNGEEIIVKEYHFNSPPDKHVLITIKPSDVLIVEGLFLFHYPKVRELLDFSVFIHVDQKIQLDRRLYRDQETRGYSREAILYQWENHVIPCFDNYLLPYQDDADFLFRNDSNADSDFQNLTEEISQRLTEHKV